MKLSVVAAMALAFFCACNYRFYLDGQFSYKNPGLFPKWRAKTYAAIVLEPADPRPDSAKYIEEVMVAAPAAGITTHNGDSVMVDQLKSEARAMGANLVRIAEKGFFDVNRVKIVADLYSFQGPQVAGFTKKIDSTHRAQAGLIRVHILCLGRPTDTIGIYFNDSLVWKCSWPFLPASLTLDRPGRISCTDSRVPGRGRRLAAGREYFFEIRFTRGSGWKFWNML